MILDNWVMMIVKKLKNITQKQIEHDNRFNAIDNAESTLLDIIGSPEDIGGSTTAGTVMGKENKILDILTKSGGAKIVKSIQSGVGRADTNTSSTTVNISAVNTAKCIIIVNTTREKADNINLDWRFSSTSITFYHSIASLSYDVTSWYWQVIEFY